jgi:hypothetical protein
LTELYELLLDKGQRALQTKKATKIRQTFDLNRKTHIERIKGKNSIVVLHGNTTFFRSDFRHEELSELLRAALVQAVSSVDRYFHDIVIDQMPKLLRLPPDKIPKDLGKYKISLAAVEVALKKAISHKQGKAKGGRPREALKQSFVEALHRDTFQNYEGICTACRLVGNPKLLDSAAIQMKTTKEKLKKRLDGLAGRRNSIVHEGDIEKMLRGNQSKLNTIRLAQTNKDIQWLRTFIQTVDSELAK